MKKRAMNDNAVAKSPSRQLVQRECLTSAASAVVE